jgi:hypothetical protein
MNAPLVDTTDFQLVADPGEDEAEDKLLLVKMEDTARWFLTLTTFPARRDLLLAYALPGVIALYLAQFISPIISGECEGDMERWVVVGDLPPIHFETQGAETPEQALRLYCAIAREWADDVMAGRSLTESYPIAAVPTRELAEMLLSRIAFIEDEIVPVVRGEVSN